MTDEKRTRTDSRVAPPTAAEAGAVSEPQAKAPATTGAAGADVDSFIARMKSVAPPVTQGRGRLAFAMDATMSRQPTWDMALALQADMFEAVEKVGGLDVQLIFFRGAGECQASRWVAEPRELARLMTTVTCAGGFTQIGKVLSHARRETEKRRVNALVYVGDAMEEDIDDLCGRAGELALNGVPVFLFQEGDDIRASRAFKEIARLTKGAHCRFDAGSASQLRQLLAAVAVYAAGGRLALESMAGKATGQGARLLIEQMK
jgi:hypothetical protein